MTTRFQLLGTLALGLGLALPATVLPAPPAKQVTAVMAILDLADDLDGSAVAVRAKHIVDKYHSCDISTVFILKKNGGAGIGSATQAGHADSIKSLVTHWSGAKPPTKQELESHQRDLLKVARVLKVMAELAPFRLALIVPKSDHKRSETAQTVAKDFKAVTSELHHAIERTDPVSTLKAAIRLNQTCIACHQVVGI
jgi:hypothetical protein